MPRVIAFVVFILGAGGLAQRPAESALTCRVVADDGTAVARATVQLTGSDGPGVRVGITDAAGDVTFTALPAGSFSLTAEKVGYVPSSYGSKRPGYGPAVPIALATGQRASVTLTMLRGSVIAGRITDSSGRPVPQVSLQAIPVRPVGVSVAAGRTFAATTDSQGLYRVFGLGPGDYVLLATPPTSMAPATLLPDDDVTWALRELSQRDPVTNPTRKPAAPPSGGEESIGHVPVYFPGTTDFDAAARIRLAPGEVRDAGFSLRLIKTVRVTGRLIGPSRSTAGTTNLVLVPDESGRPPHPQRVNDSSIRFQPDASGERFMVTGVAPGRYTLYARWDPGVVGRATEAGASTLWGRADLHVGSHDIPDVLVRLEPGPQLRGSIAFEPQSATRRSYGDSVKVALAAADGVPPLVGTLLASVNADGSFHFPSLMPWTYGVRLSPEIVVGTDAVRWRLKSAVSQGGDLADRYLELRNGDRIDVTITLTSRESEISGVLVDAAGRPTAEFAVVILSADRTFWTPDSRRVRATQPATDGAFRFTGLPAGEYDIVGVAEFDKAALGDPEYLEQLRALGFRFSLADGEKRVLNLGIVGR